MTLFALAHPLDEAVAPATLWRSWTFEPAVVILLGATALAYSLGVRRLWMAAGRGQGISRAQAAAFIAGWLTLVVALVSPLDAISDALFSVHMVQHELLILVAAPLIVLGAPLVALVWALPAGAGKRAFAAVRAPWSVRAWAAISAPASVWLLHAVALWIWHVPSLYQAALESESIHALEHTCFFVTAALFWWGLTRGRYGRLGYGAAVVYVFATAMHSGLLGAALTVSPRVWYPIYARTTNAWGLSPIEDQQLAGLIMWVPAGVIFAGMGLVLFAAWLQESGRRTRFNADPPRGAHPHRTPGNSLPRKAGVPFVSLMFLMAIHTACHRDSYREASVMTGGDPGRGRAEINKYGCDTCHTIPGVRTANGRVGPPLGGIASRVYLAGHMPNTPANMQDWIRYPHRHDSLTVMPETGVSEQDGRDIAAYLYTLR